MLGSRPAVEPRHDPGLDRGLVRPGKAAPEVLSQDAFGRFVEIESHLHPRHHARIPDRLLHSRILPDPWAGSSLSDMRRGVWEPPISLRGRLPASGGRSTPARGRSTPGGGCPTSGHERSSPGHGGSAPGGRQSTPAHGRFTPDCGRSTPGDRRSTPGGRRFVPGGRRPAPRVGRSTERGGWSTPRGGTSAPRGGSSTDSPDHLAEEGRPGISPRPARPGSGSPPRARCRCSGDRTGRAPACGAAIPRGRGRCRWWWPGHPSRPRR